mgnify:CR=1 FL=1
MSSPAFAPTVVPYLAYRSPRTPGTRGGRYHRAIIRGLEQAEAHTAKHQSPSDVHIGGLPRNKANRRSPVAYTTIPIPPNNPG